MRYLKHFDEDDRSSKHEFEVIFPYLAQHSPSELTVILPQSLLFKVWLLWSIYPVFCGPYDVNLSLIPDQMEIFINFQALKRQLKFCRYYRTGPIWFLSGMWDFE